MVIPRDLSRKAAPMQTCVVGRKNDMHAAMTTLLIEGGRGLPRARLGNKQEHPRQYCEPALPGHDNLDDAFFVIHLHVDHFVRDNQDRNFLAVRNLRAFHAQRILRQPITNGGRALQPNRVDGRNRDNRNQPITAYECLVGNEFWYPGQIGLSADEPEDDVDNILQRFGYLGYANGWLDARVWLDYFEDATAPAGRIDIAWEIFDENGSLSFESQSLEPPPNPNNQDPVPWRPDSNLPFG